MQLRLHLTTVRQSYTLAAGVLAYISLASLRVSLAQNTPVVKRAIVS